MTLFCTDLMQTGDIREDDRSAPFPERLRADFPASRQKFCTYGLGRLPPFREIVYMHMESDRVRPEPDLPGVTAGFTGAASSVIHSNENGDPKAAAVDPTVTQISCV